MSASAGIRIGLWITCVCGVTQEVDGEKARRSMQTKCSCGRTITVQPNGHDWTMQCSELPPKINTENKWGVSSASGKLGIMFPKFTSAMNDDEALTLAAWLVSMVGDDERWQEILEAVQNT